MEMNTGFFPKEVKKRMKLIAALDTKGDWWEIIESSLCWNSSSLVLLFLKSLQNC